MKKSISLLAFVILLCAVQNTYAFVTYYDTLYSPALGTSIRVCVMVPLEYRTYTDKRYPVMYTIPGSAPEANNYDCWTTFQPMKVQIMQKPMLVAMYAGYYEPEFFFNEFMPWVDSTYRTIPEGRARSVGGFSAGGFTSIDYILDHPDYFSSALTMSAGAWPQQLPELKDSIEAGAPIPPIGNFCGTEDFLLEYALALDDSLEAWGHPHILDTAPGGHTGTYWSETSVKMVDYAWENYDLTGADIVDDAPVLRAVRPAGPVRYYDCAGRSVQAGSAVRGVMIAVDAAGMVSKSLVVK